MTGPSMDHVCPAEHDVLCGLCRHGLRCTGRRSGNGEQTVERQAAGYLLTRPIQCMGAGLSAFQSTPANTGSDVAVSKPARVLPDR